MGKRHGMIKRTAKFIRDARGTMVLNDSDAKIVKKYMPYARSSALAPEASARAIRQRHLTEHTHGKPSSAVLPPMQSTRKF